MKIHGQELFDFLEERGLLYQTTSKEELKKILNGKPTTFYLGIDPTANALHIGHLCSLRTFRYLQDAGHKGVLVIGGATAQIGDPSGRQDMRKMITKEEVESNLNCIREFAKKFIVTDGDNPAIILNNNDWMKNYTYVDFMRDVGTYFNVNIMLSAEAYKKRLATGGLTFLEMGYMPIQSYDFEFLHENYGCLLQVGGSDQWGNMVAGADLIRKKSGHIVQAMTTPLLLNSKGEKMGKTAGGALWVDSGKTSVYDFYQYFMNVADSDVATLLRWFSDYSTAEINEICKKNIINAKKIMSFEITKLVHGEEKAKEAQKTAEEIFSGKGESQNMNTLCYDKNKLATGVNVCELLADLKITASRSEARRLIEQGGIVIDNEKVADFNAVIKTNDSIVVRKGKKVFVRVKGE